LVVGVAVAGGGICRMKDVVWGRGEIEGFAG